MRERSSNGSLVQQTTTEKPEEPFEESFDDGQIYDNGLALMVQAVNPYTVFDKKFINNVSEASLDGEISNLRYRRRLASTMLSMPQKWKDQVKSFDRPLDYDFDKKVLKKDLVSSLLNMDTLLVEFMS